MGEFTSEKEEWTCEQCTRTVHYSPQEHSLFANTNTQTCMWQLHKIAITVKESALIASSNVPGRGRCPQLSGLDKGRFSVLTSGNCYSLSKHIGTVTIYLLQHVCSDYWIWRFSYGSCKIARNVSIHDSLLLVHSPRVYSFPNPAALICWCCVWVSISKRHLFVCTITLASISLVCYTHTFSCCMCLATCTVSRDYASATSVGLGTRLLSSHVALNYCSIVTDTLFSFLVVGALSSVEWRRCLWFSVMMSPWHHLLSSVFKRCHDDIPWVGSWTAVYWRCRHSIMVCVRVPFIVYCVSQRHALWREIQGRTRLSRVDHCVMWVWCCSSVDCRKMIALCKLFGHCGPQEDW